MGELAVGSTAQPTWVANSGASQPQHTSTSASAPMWSGAAEGGAGTASSTYSEAGANAASVSMLTPPKLILPSVLQQSASPRSTSEVASELKRRTVQIQAVSQQIAAAQAELLQIKAAGTSSQEAAEKLEKVAELAANVTPAIASTKEKLMTALKVTQKLDAWFVENSAKMSIQDPTATPSAVLTRILESCESKLEAMASGVNRTLEATDFSAVPPPGAETISPPPLVRVEQPAGSAPCLEVYGGEVSAMRLAVPRVEQPAGSAPCLEVYGGEVGATRLGSSGGLQAQLGPSVLPSQSGLGPAALQWGWQPSSGAHAAPIVVQTSPMNMQSTSMAATMQQTQVGPVCSPAGSAAVGLVAGQVPSRMGSLTPCATEPQLSTRTANVNQGGMISSGGGDLTPGALSVIQLSGGLQSSVQRTVPASTPVLTQDQLQPSMPRTKSGTQLLQWPPGSQPVLVGSQSVGVAPPPWRPPVVPGQCPGPTPAAATPGGTGVLGMWVRDPDAG